MRHITTKPLSAQYVFRTYFVLKFVEKKQPPTLILQMGTLPQELWWQILRLILQMFPDVNITPGTVAANTDANITGVPRWEYNTRNAGGEY